MKIPRERIFKFFEGITRLGYLPGINHYEQVVTYLIEDLFFMWGRTLFM